MGAACGVGVNADGSDAPSSAPRQHRTTDNRDSSPSPRRYIPRRERQQRQQLASQQQPPRTNNHHAVTSLGATRIAEVDAPHSTAQGTQAPPQAVTTPAPPPSAPTLLSQKGGSGGGAAVAERAGGGNGDATPASMPLSVPAVGAASRPLPSSSSARAATRTGGPRDSAAPGDTSSARKRDDRSDTSSGGEPSMGMDAAVASAAASTLAPSGDAPMTRAHHPSNTPQVARGDPAQPPSSSASVARTLADRDAQVRRRWLSPHADGISVARAQVCAVTPTVRNVHAWRGNRFRHSRRRCCSSTPSWMIWTSKWCGHSQELTRRVTQKLICVAR